MREPHSAAHEKQVAANFRTLGQDGQQNGKQAAQSETGERGLRGQ